MFPNLLRTFETVVRIIGGIMNTLWICDLSMVTLPAVSRVLIFSNTIPTRQSDRIIKFLLALLLSWICILLVYAVSFRYMMMYPPTWAYDYDVPFCHLFDTLEISLSFPCIIISFLSYSSIVYLIFVFIDMNDQTNQALLNYMWILHCYVNPCMLLVFNKSIREDCFRLLRTGKIDQPPRAAGTSIVTMS
ncbi:hypothetical protein L5515_007376 [Caenorhabditis briggsae]|uniref:Uncharacterized protein n=1 Tax=Caenorhabditis briggsae TaxID=6238 RepID=A0AAE9JJD4_CAEBR|nr:hypothetical protein L5515_007376 [Caenorhabditis briggsae]